ncbi:MAG TPA: DUF2188 domain-containing protein [Gaiellaceae bacterium]|nr:DUF2188 domain-containing protein [Gaiellaceae bacterium]
MTDVVRVRPVRDGWEVDAGGKKTHYETQGKAETAARLLASTGRLEFVLYGRDGVIRDRVSYGGDTSHLPATEL